MDVNGVSNNNNVWQSILKALDANKTADNKNDLESVKEQIKPFFEEGKDSDVSLNLDDTSIKDVPNDTIKIKDGEAGSKTYIEKLLSSGNISGKFNADDIKYDDKGRIISFTSYVKNNSNGHHEISYNDDGTITITRTDINPISVRRFDKDGNEIKDLMDTEIPETTKEITPSVPQESISTKPTMPTVPAEQTTPTIATVPTKPTVPVGGQTGGSTVGGYDSRWRGGFGNSLVYRLNNFWQQNSGNIQGGIFSRITTTFFNRINGFLNNIFSMFN